MLNILVDIDGDLTRIAHVRDGLLVDLTVSTTQNTSSVGNVYLGRVERVIGALAAAFIDIGLPRSGFLALAEIRPLDRPADKSENISDYLNEGDRVLVQVQRDGFEDKGPKLTTRLSLTGRTLVMTPEDGQIRISRRIEDAAVRDRLTVLLEDLTQDDEGFIVRTVAAQASDELITREVETLREDWAVIEAGRDTGRPPALLFTAADPLLASLRDTGGQEIEEIVVNDGAAFAQAQGWCRKFAPELQGRLRLHQDKKPLFESFQSGDDSVEADIESALEAQVPLPSGGRLHFSETPALVAIDVDAGGTSRGGPEETALATNLEAAPEIARQMRLRNLGGLLVIDFISMKRSANQSKLLDKLKSAVSDDPVPVFIGGFTRFGLVELTRRRLSATLISVMTGDSSKGRQDG